MKQVTSLIIVVAVLILGVVLYGVCTETVGAGYEGFVYDRTAGKDDNVIEGTSVINNPRTGLIWLNPITQDVLKYPTTIVAKSWSRIEEGDNKNDMSMQVGSKEGKNIDADVYISVKASDTAKIIRSFGTKKFDSIIDNEVAKAIYVARSIEQGVGIGGHRLGVQSADLRHIVGCDVCVRRLSLLFRIRSLPCVLR